jgi:hypothetical protein
VPSCAARIASRANSIGWYSPRAHIPTKSR